MGFDGRYKLGFWVPVRVTVEGADQLESPRLEVVAPDSDGSPAVVATDLSPDAPTSLVVDSLTRVGRRDAVIRVRLLDGERLVHQWRSGQDLSARFAGLPATARMTVEVGAKGLIDKRARHAVRVEVENLPDRWLAYEGVTTLLLASSDAKQLEQFKPAQARAVRDWVEQGGRLVIAAGANAAKLIGPAAPFADLSPGELSEVVTLPQTGVIEDYADSDEPIGVAGGAGLSVARLRDVRGAIEIHAGGRATEMPLVVRSLFGFGEVTFVALDLDTPELQDWVGFDRLVQQLLRSQPSDQTNADEASTGPLVARAYNDLAGALYVKLGRSFTGVRSLSILSLVAAVLTYMALLGPGAYLLGKRFGAMQLVWLTFPLIALGVGGAAWWWGAAATGDRARVNQLQVIDIDCSISAGQEGSAGQGGAERGVLWAQAFSPRAELYNLSSTPTEVERGYVSWFGLPGAGLGGMQTPADSLLSGDVSYLLAPSMEEGLIGAPINRRASKALTARWLAKGRPVLQFDLSPTDSGLVEGTIVNQTDLTLTDCKLIAGGWAWRLPSLPPGGVASIDSSVTQARPRTLLLQELGSTQGRDAMAWGAVDRLDAIAVANLMMFHEELAAKLDSRYQSFSDLSHALRIGRPILVARCDKPRAELLRDGQPLDPDADTLAVFYRFLGPAIRQPDQQDRP